MTSTFTLFWLNANSDAQHVKRIDNKTVFKATRLGGQDSEIEKYKSKYKLASTGSEKSAEDLMLG